MTDAPPAEHDAVPPLRRSREHKMVSGVCGGLGRFFDMDPVVFRVVLGVLAVTGGLGLIAYGFAWLLIPLEGEDENEARRMLSGRVEGAALTAVLCALVGCGLFLSMLNNSDVMSFALMLTIAISGAAYWSRHRQPEPAEDERPDDRTGSRTDSWADGRADGRTDTGADSTQKPQKPHKTHRPHKTMEAPPETQAPPAPGAPSWWRDPVRDAPAAAPAAAGTGHLWGPDDSPALAAGHGGPAAARERSPLPSRPVTGRPLGGWTFLLALVALGLGTGLTWHQQPLGTSLEIGLACALGVFGLGITVSSLYGHTGGGTVVAAVLTGALLTGAAALPKSVTAEWTRTTWRPSAAADVRDHYELGSGVGVLDLTGVRWPRSGPGAGTGTPPAAVTAEVGAGQLRVVLPPDITAELDIEVGVGDIQLPGEGRDDIDVQPGGGKRLTLGPAPGQPSHGTLRLELKAGLGQVEVTRATA
ncbi:PspC domain-containing protein [Streptomyces sp. NPDC053048]|uniref:PspC domain-containing protein n=1 Tax=Streptomyces sp. NPDC053048 TaxID=3365694 RepID=UPI0037D727B2